MKPSNLLINETSPYLLQHAHNPVNWYPWGEEAFEKAKAENKLTIISIGYSACHWCHVMEGESFEDIETATVMNERFINVKVDREERPDVDQIYMNAVQLMTGRGGWPLNCIVLPDGRPIWGGTYFRKDKWIEQISTIADFYEQEPQKVYEYAERLTQGIQQSELVEMNPKTPLFTKNQLDEAYEIWSNHFDTVEGGPDKAPKFPLPNNYQFLLRYAHLSNNKEALKQVKLTLDKIAFGGIYDHLGGGITRYSTDKLWKVPHFEKMLYDNAQMVSLYCEAYQKFKDPVYKEFVYGSLDFISRELTSSEGAFYSALDADSEGEEGKFYIWSKEELQSILKDNYPLFADYYNINKKGYWEHNNYILLRDKPDSEIASKHQLRVEELQKQISNSKAILMQYRAKRIRPGLDDKTLSSWNGLMLKAYADAHLTFGEERFLNASIKNANFLLQKQVRKDGGLNHSYKEGRSTINGYLEDYAFVIEAFIKLYEATFNEKWLKEASALTSYAIEHFYDYQSGMFFFTSNEDPALIARKMEINDNVIPASNSTMALNLFTLSHHYSRADYSNMSLQMLNNINEDINKYPSGYSNWLNLLLYNTYPFYELVISGKESQQIALAIHSEYLPNKLMAGAIKESKLPLLNNRYSKEQTRIFVCENKMCKMPTNDVATAQKLMKDEL